MGRCVVFQAVDVLKLIIHRSSDIGSGQPLFLETRKAAVAEVADWNDEIASLRHNRKLSGVDQSRISKGVGSFSRRSKKHTASQIGLVPD